MSNQMQTTGVVSPAWLQDRLADPSVAVIEVSRHPDDAGYREQHIPGARYVYWKDLVWHPTDRQFAEPALLASRLGNMGVPTEATVVIYGDPVQFGTYAFFAMTLAGFRNVRVLDGGKEAWLAQGREVTSELPPKATPVDFPAPTTTRDDASRATRDDVLAAISDGSTIVVDLRTDEEYSGERVSPRKNPIDHGAERKGRIPGARQLFYQRLLNDDQTLRDPDEVAALFADAGVTADRDVILYCRLGHRASLGWVALSQLLGHERVRVYDGSWTEWGSIVGMPIER
jgi:thiosulfate/3-mercaptopyruvate sulfurtransferase